MQIALLIGMSTVLVACPGLNNHPVAQIKWDDPRILRGTYTGDYGEMVEDVFVKKGTLTFEFTPEYVNASLYNVTGHFQLDDKEKITLQGGVNGGNEAQFVQPQHTGFLVSFLDARAETAEKSYQIHAVNLTKSVITGALYIYDKNSQTLVASHTFKISKSQ